MGFLISSFFELIWILVTNILNIMLVIFVEIIKLIPFGGWVIIFIIVAVAIIKKLYNYFK